MNLEKLISKYLDGELSIEEDRQLRDLISNDPESKEIFEESVELNYLFKQDSESTKVPKDFKSDVEDKILMRILSDETSYSFDNEKVESKKRRVIPILLPIFLVGSVFAFLGIFDRPTNIQTVVSEPVELSLFTPNEINIISEEIESNSNPVKINSTKVENMADEAEFNNSKNHNDGKSKKGGIKPSQISETFSDLLEKNSSDFLTTNAEQTLMSINEKDYNSNVIEKSSISDKFNVKMGTNLTNPSLSEPYSINNDNSFFDFIDFSDGRLEFSSIAGSEMIRSGYDPTNVNSISNFAQSIAIRVDRKQKFGVEFGYNEYTFSSMQRVLVPFQELEGFIYDPSSGDRYTSSGISTNLESDESYRNFWAVVFAERIFLEKELLNFSARVGFGATNSGPLAYGRVLGNYELFNGISLSAGLDMRMFQTNLSGFVNQSNGMKGNISLVYGINFTF